MMKNKRAQTDSIADKPEGKRSGKQFSEGMKNVSCQQRNRIIIFLFIYTTVRLYPAEQCYVVFPKQQYELKDPPQGTK